MSSAHLLAGRYLYGLGVEPWFVFLAGSLAIETGLAVASRLFRMRGWQHFMKDWIIFHRQLFELRLLFEQLQIRGAENHGQIAPEARITSHRKTNSCHAATPAER